MPDLYFDISWPDGSKQRCYSPSTIVKKYYREGEKYPLHKFVYLSRDAFRAASDRVKAVHRTACSRALTELEGIEKRALTFNNTPDAMVACIAFIER